MSTYDVVIIGGGPGGYVAAIRARQLGLKTALVEREHLGGVCLNWGCIPTKALLHNAEVIRLLDEGKTYGFDFDRDSLKVDYGVAHKRSRQVSGRLVKGVQFLMKKNGVEVFEASGSLKSATEVALSTGDTLSTRHVILATGARARSIPGVEIDGERILNARHALELSEVPASIVVIGAGAIGVEFAHIWRAYGAEVTIVEMLPNVLPLEDADVSQEMAKALSRQGIKVHTGTRVEKIDVASDGSGLILSVVRDDQGQTIPAEKVLMAIGVQPNSEDLGLEAAGVRTERGWIAVDETMRTSLPNVYAIGDVTGKMPLAHVASAQAIVAVEAIAGLDPETLIYPNIPRCTYASPEVASVGLTEAQAREEGYDVKVGQFPFRANGKALAIDDYEGFVKIVSDARYDQILGVHMIGPHVTDMIAGATGMIRLETTTEELARTVHPHPTLSEVIMEAAHALLGHAIHI
ncbi:MAG: dihydrolipoyl dehydrogenase [Anaerolineae bacterium]